MTREQIETIEELVAAFGELGTLLSIVASTDVDINAAAVMHSAARLQEALVQRLDVLTVEGRRALSKEASHD